MPLTHPWTDWFGTRLEPERLLGELSALGLSDVALVVADTEVVLRVPDNTPKQVVSRALVGLIEELSPLSRCRVEVGEVKGAELVDQRTRHPSTICLAESFGPEDLDARIDDLIARLGPPVPPDQAMPFVGGELGELIAKKLRAAGWDLNALGVVSFERPGADAGVRPAQIIAATTSLEALRWLKGALADPREGRSSTSSEDPGVLLDGLVWGAARRPTLALPRSLAQPSAPVWTDSSRCDGCGICTEMCPSNLLDLRGQIKAEASTFSCLQCYECVDACPMDAMRPVMGRDSATHSRALAHRGPWLSRLRGAPGPLQPAPFPPSYLLPKPGEKSGPTWTLGLAILTMAEHAAVLLKDDEIVGAVEEEKLVRIRHYGRRLAGRADFVTPAVDPTLMIEEALCHRAVQSLLESANITLDDLDIIAVNGLHGRYRKAFTHLETKERLPVIRAGRLVSVPHHLAHAASTYRVAGVEDAWIFTVDGRGDRETAALFRAEAGHIAPVATLLSLDDQSVGGVYQTVTEELGFGSFGQGSLMALAGFGEAKVDLSAHLSAQSVNAFSVHETGLRERLASVKRGYEEPIEAKHQDVAASIQSALEDFAINVVSSVTGQGPLDALCLAGGVTLNCHMNRELKLALKPSAMFVQPAANDGGTALGAAAEAWALLHGERNLQPMTHAQLGPSYDEATMEGALRRSGLTYTRSEDIAREAAERLCRGQILAWFQGGLEYGPRALGGRSLLADPRDPSVSDRLNRLKDRQLWRPFAPSVLSGHEAEWFEGGFDSRFMLFTLPVAQDKRQVVPAIVHVDGTSRPQVVHATAQPAYHALISAFFEETGVPMVVDTSFNRRGEPIVNTPEEAIEAFVALGADAMALGPFLVEHPSQVAPEGPALPSFAALAGREGHQEAAAFIRLSAACSMGCSACPVTESPGPLALSVDIDTRLVEAREEGYDRLTLVVSDAELRGEALLGIVSRAKAMGFAEVMLRTHGVALSHEARLLALLNAGIDRVELVVKALSAKRHDALGMPPGAMAEVGRALELCQRQGVLEVLIPLVRDVMPHLHRMLSKLAGVLGERPVTLRYPRLRLTPSGLVGEPLMAVEALGKACAQIFESGIALPRGLRLQGIPSCLIAPPWRRLITQGEEPEGQRRARCKGCDPQGACPGLSPLYQAAVGTGALER